MKYPTFGTLEDACAACGIVPKAIHGTGFIVTNVIGARKRGGGRIKPFDDESGGYVKNWSDGREAVFFYGYQAGVRVPYEVYCQRSAAIRRMRQAEEDRHRQLQLSVASMAAELLAAAEAVASCHPYLYRKRVANVVGAPMLEIDGVKAQSIVDTYPIFEECPRQRLDYLGSRLLLVPMVLDAGPVSLQLISARGQKTFLKGGRMKGTAWRPEGFPVASGAVERVGLAEGVATALSVRKMYGVPCLAGMNAGNLVEAVKVVRQCYPKATIQLFADRDANGVGEEGAQKAAKAVARSKLYVCPEFSIVERERFRQLTGGDNPTDYNDLMIARGI